MISRRTQIVLLVLVVCSTALLAGLWRSYSARPSEPRATVAAQPTEATSRAQALTVLRSWDEDRATAYAEGDSEALRKLYVPGSDSGLNDRRVLRQYLARGFRVHGMRTQILDIEIVDRGENSLSLLVTDRLSAAVAVGSGARVRLPRDQATTREIELKRVGLQWVVDEAMEIGSGPDAVLRDQPGGGRSSADESTSTTPAS